MIKVFTIDHEDFLYSQISEDDLKSPKTAAEALAEATVVIDKNLDLQEVKTKFLDFLIKNDHIFFDGFLRICIYDKHDK